MRESVDIGTWVNYQPYTSLEQRQLQRDNLTYVSAGNRLGNHVSFVYSDYIANLNSYVEDSFASIPIEDTVTALENEVYYTTKIEGAKTTRKRTNQLHNGMPIDENNAYSEQMVVNAFNATKLMNLYGNELTEDKLVQIWKTLTYQACDNLDVQGEMYRVDDVSIGTYQPVSAEEVPELMTQFMDFYNNAELNDIPVVKAIVIHYLFETIHPFCDGNGRMGRLLLNNFLIKQGFEVAKALSFSMEIDKNRGGYDAAFVKSENIYNDCTPLIEYMLDIMASACYHVLEKRKIKTIVFD